MGIDESLKEGDNLDFIFKLNADRIVNAYDKALLCVKCVGLIEYSTKEHGQHLRRIINPEIYHFLRRTVRKYSEVPSQKQILEERKTSDVSEHDPVLVASKQTLLKSSTSISSAILSRDLSGSTISSSLSGIQDHIVAPSLVLGRRDNELSKMMLLLAETPGIKDIVDKYFERMSPGVKILIRNLKIIRECMFKNIYDTEETKKLKELQLKKSYYLNERYKENIKILQEKNENEDELDLVKENQDIIINNHCKKVEQLKKNTKDWIENYIFDSEDRMIKFYKSNEEKQESLKVRLSDAILKYENFLEDNLGAEKQLRIKRAKIKNQLFGWLQKFDQDMMEKQSEEEELQEIFEKEKAESEQLQEQFNKVEKEYDEAMLEKEEFNKQILKQKLFMFALKQCIKKIQKAWREYKHRKTAKKKPGKSKES